MDPHWAWILNSIWRPSFIPSRRPLTRRRRHFQCADAVALHGEIFCCSQRGTISASPLELKVLDCARRCEMSFAVLVMLASAVWHQLTFICCPFRELHTMIRERHTATAWLMICCQALSPHGHGTRTSLLRHCAGRGGVDYKPLNSMLYLWVRRILPFGY